MRSRTIKRSRLAYKMKYEEIELILEVTLVYIIIRYIAVLSNPVRNQKLSNQKIRIYPMKMLLTSPNVDIAAQDIRG